MTQTSKAEAPVSRLQSEYAQALFELALGEGNTREVSDALDLVEREMAENPSYAALLASPAIPRKERMASLETVFGKSVPRTVLVLLQLMVSRGHASDIDEMIRAYRILEREHRKESVAYVTSAVELTEEQQAALRGRLEQMFSRKITLRCEVDPSLIGGIRVETEGRVLDGSIRSRLEQIKEVMDS